MPGVAILQPMQATCLSPIEAALRSELQILLLLVSYQKHQHATGKLASAGKKALFAVCQHCSDLCIQNVPTRGSLFPSLVRPVLFYGCELWGLEGPSFCFPMTSIHNLFTKSALLVRKSVPADVCLYELGRVPLCLIWQKMVLKHVSQLSSLPDDRLVKLMFNHACSTQPL